MNRYIVENAFKKFLLKCDININFSNELSLDQTRKILMIILNSETNKFDGTYENYDYFNKHVNELKKKEEIIPEYDGKLTGYSSYFNEPPVKVLKKSVMMYYLTIFLEDLGLDSCNGYLESRSWFINNPELQDITIKVALDGNADQIDVRSGDYKDHIKSLLY